MAQNSRSLAPSLGHLAYVALLDFSGLGSCTLITGLDIKTPRDNEGEDSINHPLGNISQPYLNL